MSDCLWPHGLHLARLPCLTPSPRACSNSYPWVSDVIQSSYPVIPFSSCLQSFPAPGSFLMSRLFSSGGQSIGTSASASVHPMNIQDWFSLGLTSLISLQFKELSSFQHCNLKASVLWLSGFFMVQLSHPDMYTGKTMALIIWNFVGKVMSLLFNLLSRCFIAFHPRSKCLLISWLQSPSAVILDPRK